MELRIKHAERDLPFINIEAVEKKYNAKYMGEFCIKQSKGWVNCAIAVFYQPNLPVGRTDCSHYLGIFAQEGRIFVCNAESAFSQPIAAAIAPNGDVIYSRYRWDCRWSDDGSTMIDGGRDYVRRSGGKGDAYIVAEKDQLKIEFPKGI